MNKKLVIGSGVFTLATAGLMLIPSFAGAQSTNANINGNGGRYGYTQSLTAKAESLGMTSDELKTELETKTLQQIADEKGVNIDKVHDAMQSAAQKRWADNGLSEEEVANRLQDMKDRQASCDGTGTGMGGGQHGRSNR
ncbi:MAG: hypothetical protein WA087_00960 [Candidatus Saccharimonadales bacterium]